MKFLYIKVLKQYAEYVYLFYCVEGQIKVITWLVNLCNQIQLHKCTSYSYCACSWRQQTNPLRKKNFPWTIGSCISCGFVKIWSIWEVWRALKKLELLSATPWATLTHLSCSPNFLHASYLDERMLKYETIVNYEPKSMHLYLSMMFDTPFIHGF